MSFPADVSVATITVGSVIDFFGEETAITVTVAPVLGGDGKAKHIVHAASGNVLLTRSMTFKGSPGGPVVFSVPHVDQEGFVTTAGLGIQMWGYAATVQYGPGKNDQWTKTFQPLVGQDLIDLDLIPDGIITEPVSAPLPEVTSVNGQTGAVSVPVIDSTTIEEVLPARLSDTALNAAIDGQVTPAVVAATGERPVWATGNAPFDPKFGTYNLRPDNLAYWRRAKARAAAGLGQGHVTAGIDSNSYGAAATGTSNPKPETSWPGRFRSLCDATYGPAGSGIVAPWDTLGTTGTPAHDPRWTFAGAITKPASQTGIYDRGAIRMDSPGDGTTYVDFAADDVDEFWLYMLYGNGSRFQVSIDGGAAQLLANGSTVDLGLSAYQPEAGYGTRASNGQVVFKIPVTRGAHTIRISPPTAAGFYTTVTGIEARIAGEGVRVTNYGNNGRSSGDLVLESALGNRSLGLYFDQARADLAVLMVSGNDFNGQAPVSWFKGNIAKAIDRQRATGQTSYGGTYAGKDVLLVVKPQPDYPNTPPGATPAVPLTDYYRALYELADEKDIPLLDLGARFVDYTSSADMFADPVHVNDLGAADIAQAVYNALHTV